MQSASRTERLIMRTCALCGLSIGVHGWLEEISGYVIASESFEGTAKR